MALDGFPASVTKLWIGNCLNVPVFHRNVVRMNVIGITTAQFCIGLFMYSVKFTDN